MKPVRGRHWHHGPCWQMQQLQRLQTEPGIHPRGWVRSWISFLSGDKKADSKVKATVLLSGGEVQERLKILLSSAKFPCSFCAQFLHFPGQLIIMSGDSLVPWPCQSQGGKWQRWPGQGAKEEQTGRKWVTQKGGEWGGQWPSPQWRRVTRNAQIRTLLEESP